MKKKKIISPGEPPVVESRLDRSFLRTTSCRVLNNWAFILARA